MATSASAQRRRGTMSSGRATMMPLTSELDDLVAARGGLAEAAHRIRRQARVDLVQPQVDLAVGEREQAAALAIALDQEGAEPLDLEDPHGLRDAELREPVDLAHAPDAAAVRGAHAV